MSLTRPGLELCVVPPRKHPRIDHEYTQGGHIRYVLAEAPLNRQQPMVAIRVAELRLCSFIAARWRGPHLPGLSALSAQDYSFDTLVMAEKEIVTAFRTAAELRADDYIEARALLQTVQRVTAVVWE